MADDIENQPAPTAPMAQASQSIPFSVASIEPSAAPATEMDQNSSAMVVDTEQPAAPTNTNTTTSTTTTTLTENHSAETPSIPEIGENAVATVERALDVEQDNETSHAIDNGSAEVDGDGDIDMSDHHEYSEDESEYEPEADSPPPSKGPKQPRSPSSSNRPPKTPQGTRPPKTPTSRVRSGRVEKSSSPASQGNLRCPVKGCGQTFTGRNPRQSLWHHLKYYATRGLPDRQDFEKLHGEAHSEMKREAEPKGTPVERNRISSSDYRKKNPEKAKTSARLSNFRARARKKGYTTDQDVEDAVHKWEREWQEKQAKEASEYFSGILLSAFE